MKKYLLASFIFISVLGKSQITFNLDAILSDTCTNYYTQAQEIAAKIDTCRAGDTICFFYDCYVPMSFTSSLPITMNGNYIDIIPNAQICAHPVNFFQGYFYYWKVPDTLAQPMMYYVQIMGTQGKQIYVSGIDTLPTQNNVGIMESQLPKSISRTEYYDLSGRPCQQNTEGVIIRITWYNDGSAKREKVMMMVR